MTSGVIRKLSMASPLIQKFSSRIVAQTGAKCTASMIFFHGTGDSGKGIQDWLDSLCEGKFEFPHMRIIIPTAPVRPCTYNGGARMRMWFDRLGVSPDVAEHSSVNDICEEISHLIDNEVKAGIPKKRIILGGFSNGGCLSLHLGYRFHREVAGVICLSSFLQKESSVFDALKKDSTGLPPLFQCHGALDQLVQCSWAEKSFRQLQELGVRGEFQKLDNVDHQMSVQEIQTMKDWINAQVPENASSL